MSNEQQTELTEDMEVIGPGQMLREARESLKLSQQDVATKLNFTLVMVKNIENEVFDKKLPSTYTRGYLRNYARLLHLNEDEILASYELLGVAEAQQAEMQSFSKITKKQAENNLLMWFTYLIILLLIASTVVWWWQEHQQPSTNTNIKKNVTNLTKPVQSTQNKPEKTVNTPEKNITNNNAEQSTENTDDNLNSAQQNTLNIADNNDEASTGKSAVKDSANNGVNNIAATATTKNVISQEKKATLAKVVFTFSGDCWVNIYDATGEHIAWGIKKADYVMRITGQPPFNVTLGKPELVSIEFNGEPVDMSSFNSGNVAKFTLPIQP